MLKFVVYVYILMASIIIDLSIDTRTNGSGTYYLVNLILPLTIANGLLYPYLHQTPS